MDNKELIEKIKPYMYCYQGSGMLSNTYDDEVATKFSDEVIDIFKQCFVGLLHDAIREHIMDKITNHSDIETFLSNHELFNNNG